MGTFLYSLFGCWNTPCVALKKLVLLIHNCLNNFRSGWDNLKV